MEQGRKVSVRLADGTCIFTSKYVRCYVDFGQVAGYLYFTVLPQCPLVLGMSFLRAYNPTIDFKNLTVMLEKSGTSCPPVQSLNKFGVLLIDQSEANLPQLRSVVDDQTGVHAGDMCDLAGDQFDRCQRASVDLQAAEVSTASVLCDYTNYDPQNLPNLHKPCSTFGENRQLAASMRGGAAKNRIPASSELGQGQSGHPHCSSHRVDSVGVGKHTCESGLDSSCMMDHLDSACFILGAKCTNQQSALDHQLEVQGQGCKGCSIPYNTKQHTGKGNVHSSMIEECGIKSFCRGIQKQQYEEVYLCNLQIIQDEQQLNFTHRTAHGSHGEGDKRDNEQLANAVLRQLKQAYPRVFQEPTFPITRQDPYFYHQINLKDTNCDPPRKKLYPLDSQELVALKEQLQELLDSGRIRHSASPYGAPILFAKKKDSTKLRMCIDYRALNKQTILDRYPLPRYDELFTRLQGARLFSKLDLADGYHQIPMFKGDEYKTAFSTRYGQYEFTVMPFGLTNAPATFQRIMNKILFELLDKCVLVYLDDILIYSRDVPSHIRDLHSVFDILARNQLHLKESKCALFLNSVEYLGHTITANGLSVEKGKVEAVDTWPQPTCINEVQQFLGLCNYYRRFVKGFAKIAQPLTDLTRKGVNFVWSAQCEAAFNQLKKCLLSAPCLKLFDPLHKSRVICDASQYAIGAVLEQLSDDDQWHPVEFFSKRLNDAQQNYSANEREMLAIIMSLERWRQHLVGYQFIVLTDHVSLVHFTTQAKLSRRQARWLEFLGQFQFEIIHIAGKSNAAADSLSRIPQQTLGLSNIISLNDEQLFLDRIRECQAEAGKDKWFQSIKSQCIPGNKLFAIRNGVVCRLINDYYAPVIPNNLELRRLLFLEFHASGLGGHVGARKLYQLMKNRVWFSGMQKAIDKFIKECAVCQVNKTSTQKPYGLLQPQLVPKKPFDIISLDFITSLPTTDSGNDCMLVIVDTFTKYVNIIPCKINIDAVGVAQLVYDNIICQFGVPSKIISDRDVRFTSLFWQALHKVMNIKLNLSTAFHPQTDGQTERFNRSLEQILRCYCSPMQNDWDMYAKQVQFTLNNTVHQGTQFSPLKALYGQEVSLPFDCMVSNLQDCKLPTVADFITVRQKIVENLQKYQNSMKNFQDKKRRDIEFAIGDKVYVKSSNLKLPIGLTSKLAPKYIGPYNVLKQVGKVSYHIDLPSELGRLHPVFHVSMLKPHFGRILLSREPLFSVDDNEFEVERILQKRLVRNKIQYLIKWVGYPVYDATWEPIENLTNCQSAIASFEKHSQSTIDK